MGYTDQSGIELWQHLTLALCCCVSYVVPIRINNINNTHLCDLAVLLVKGKTKQNKGVCKTEARIHPNFLCTEYDFWKGNVHKSVSIIC